MGTHYCVNRVPSASPCSSLHQLPDLSSLNSLLDLGNSFYEQRQFQKALKCYYQALEGFRVLFNKDNPAIALTLNNIALVYKNQGDFDSAMKLFQEALFIYTQQDIQEIDIDIYQYTYEVGQEMIIYKDYVKQYWPDFQQLEKIRKRDKQLQKILHNFKKAEINLTNRTFPQFQQLCGLLNNIGVSYLHLQDYQKSYKYLKQCIEQDEQNELSFCKSQELALQTSDSSSDVLNNLGIVCEQLGKLEESIKYYQQAVQVHEMNASLQKSASVWNNMVSVYLAMNNFEKCYECCLNSLKIRQQIYGEESLQTIESYQNLATLYQIQKKFDLAIDTQKLILKIKSNHTPQDFLSLSKTISQTAILYLELQNYEKALQLQLSAVNFREKQNNKDDGAEFDLAENHFNIGFIYQQMKEFENSNKYFQNSMEILDKKQNIYFGHIVNVLYNQSFNHEQMGNFKESLEKLKKNLEILNIYENLEFEQKTKIKIKEIEYKLVNQQQNSKNQLKNVIK